MKKVAIGLSGGVDSAVSAALLLEQGCDVTAVFLECWRGPGCRAEEDRKDALDVALKLGIPFQVLDFKAAYKAKVVDYFKSEYQVGRTPNPDTMCNREIKFGLFYDWAMEHGFDAVATGHYAKVHETASRDNVAISHPVISTTQEHAPEVEKSEGDRHVTTSSQPSSKGLFQGLDPKKDQSYFLYQLRPDQLEHILFPIGHLTKQEVRAKATELGLPVATKPDSQGICFIGEVSVTDFLKDLGLKERTGEVVLDPRYHHANARHSDPALAGEESHIIDNSKIDNCKFDDQPVKLGHHRGAWFYTIGQRHGFTIHPDKKAKTVLRRIGLKPAALPPLFVTHKDVDTNVLYIAPREGLYQDTCEIEHINWLIPEPDIASVVSQELTARIRHGGALEPVSIELKDQTTAVITFAKPVFALAPGQALVIYHQKRLIAGGTISTTREAVV